MAPQATTPNMYPVIDPATPMTGGAPMGTAPIPGATAGAPAILGRLRLQLIEANLKHNDLNMLMRMSPFVIVRINGREERSMVIEMGGAHPVWIN